MAQHAKFDVRYDHADRILHWTMRDFWEMADVAAFATAMQRAVAVLGAPPHVYDALCDSRGFPVQSGEVSLALGRINDVGRTMRSGRTAIVVGSTMNKLQAQRTLIDPDLRVFLTLDAAMAWLGEKP
ncbi:MAG TPA: hypothetical protein VF649_13060 [Sphingomonas sp.]|uniref:hypothetical protein n=1 Tax=Sphingomonas sp. TaxID=28214 RepID=UPI002EDAE19C